MYGVSPRFLEILASGHMRPAIRVRTTDGVDLSVPDGTVTMDCRRSITRTCELTLLPTSDLSSSDLFALMMDPQTEIIVERGLWVDGEPEYVPLGVFGTDTADVDRANKGSVSFAGSDRAKRISRAAFIDPYPIAAGSSLATAATALLQDRLLGCPCSFPNVSETIAAAIVLGSDEGSDPWAALQSIFSDHGYDLHFDGNGVAVAVLIPDPAASKPVFSFGSGETSMVLGAQSKGSLEETYTGVVASGEGSGVGTPVRAVVWDEDPASPTYIGSGLGKAVYRYSSPLLTTVSRCESAARSMLARMKGRTLQLSWPAIVNPALEPLDVVSVEIDGVAHACVIDSVPVPLKASEAMTASARETRF